MTDYYDRNLSGERLRRVYALASPRVRRYLDAEIDHVLSRLHPGDEVLELGCGYGRIARRLTGVAARVVGVDNAAASIDLARALADGDARLDYRLGDAAALDLPDTAFDAVLCLQNGICAFRVDPRALLAEALRVTRPGGLAIFTSYADRFWPYRLDWFRVQADAGLLGPLDEAACRDGVVVCRDGFRSGRCTPAEFRDLCASLDVTARIEEVDGACVVCEIERPDAVSATGERSCG